MDMNTKELTQRDTAQAVNPLVPPVDIVEDAEGITLRADLPGVDRENLNIGVDGETLTLEATVSLGETAGIQPVYSEIRVAQYRRSFVLGRDLDANRIEASIRDGVLTLRIPKAEQAKPRRIEVKAA
jgi:HSP20 family protein